MNRGAWQVTGHGVIRVGHKLVTNLHDLISFDIHMMFSFCFSDVPKEMNGKFSHIFCPIIFSDS